MEPMTFDLRNSSKNYLFAPMKLTEGEAFAYEIDLETVISFSDRNLA